MPILSVARTGDGEFTVTLDTVGLAALHALLGPTLADCRHIGGCGVYQKIEKLLMHEPGAEFLRLSNDDGDDIDGIRFSEDDSEREEDEDGEVEDDEAEEESESAARAGEVLKEVPAPDCSFGMIAREFVELKVGDVCHDIDLLPMLVDRVVTECGLMYPVVMEPSERSYTTDGRYVKPTYTKFDTAFVNGVFVVDKGTDKRWQGDKIARADVELVIGANVTRADGDIGYVSKYYEESGKFLVDFPGCSLEYYRDGTSDQGFSRHALIGFNGRLIV